MINSYLHSIWLSNHKLSAVPRYFIIHPNLQRL